METGDQIPAEPGGTSLPQDAPLTLATPERESPGVAAEAPTPPLAASGPPAALSAADATAPTSSLTSPADARDLPLFRTPHEAPFAFESPVASLAAGPLRRAGEPGQLVRPSATPAISALPGLFGSLDRSPALGLPLSNGDGASATPNTPLDHGVADAPASPLAIQPSAAFQQARRFAIAREDAPAEAPAVPDEAEAAARGEIGPAAAEAPPAAAAPGGAPAGSSEQEIEKLTEKVWQRIRRMMQLERERRRGMP